MSNIRKNGGHFAIRFRYDADGVANPEPNSFEQIEKHMKQIKNSGLLQEYKDIFAYLDITGSEKRLKLELRGKGIGKLFIFYIIYLTLLLL